MLRELLLPAPENVSRKRRGGENRWTFLPQTFVDVTSSFLRYYVRVEPFFEVTPACRPLNTLHRIGSEKWASLKSLSPKAFLARLINLPLGTPYINKSFCAASSRAREVGIMHREGRYNRK